MTFRLRRISESFTIFHGSIPVASGDVHCYHGHWVLRSGHVIKAYRGNGLQRKLIRARVRYAKSRGAKRVTVWIDPLNSHSLNNVIAEGFRFLHRAPRTFDRVACVGLEKRLA